jgi:hypothetical protein
LALLPPRIKAAQEKEMGEMMGKLKQVSHSVLFSIKTVSLRSTAWKWYPEAFRAFN